MELTEHRPGNHHVIRAITDEGVRIDDTVYRHSLVLGARYLEPDWPVTALAELNEATLEVLIRPRPELVILGIGRKHQPLNLEMQRLFVQQGIGIECMTLPAAARTFNILMSENRRALAGLILASTTTG
jgi:uncharacterized protein